MSEKCKRVLHVVSAMHRGGAETMIMNLYRNIDRNKVQFDFVVHSDENGHFNEEIQELGGRIIRCNSLGSVGPVKYIKELVGIIKNNGPFQAVHSHTDFQGGFVAMASKIAGVKQRICHSHNTHWVANPSIVKKIQLFVFKELIDRYSTDLCSCGNEASKFLFKNNKIVNGKVNIINNGIDIDAFKVSYDKKLRKELNISDDEIVIGSIARFSEQKNHKFMIEFARYLKDINIKFKMLLIGQGPLLNDIKEKVMELNLDDNVIFLGVREDIPKIMDSLDIFLMPSLHEGMPVVLIEAQAAGVKCLISDNITREIDLGLNLIEFCSLEEDLEKWKELTLKMCNSFDNVDKNRYSNSKLTSYDVKENVNQVLKIYKL